MWQPVVGPVVLGVIIAGVLFFMAGPALAAWLRSVVDQAKKTLSTMREIWSSKS